jgi:hypothetical protein
MIEGIARGPGDCFEGRVKTQGPYRGRDGADVSRTTVSRSRFVSHLMVARLGQPSTGWPVEYRAGGGGSADTAAAGAWTRVGRRRLPSVLWRGCRC